MLQWDDPVPASRCEVSARVLPIKLAEAGSWYGGDDVMSTVLGKGIISLRQRDVKYRRSI